jgi:NADPH-dependent 2,4-dienoyl-CoA reductase/sulfur reductase-like enzyme/rhodanese-related sulfurtransferase
MHFGTDWLGVIELETGKRRVVIVGASAAGLRCASRLARLQPDWSISVVEEREFFSYAACGLPYVLSGDIPDTEALRRTGDGARRDTDYFAQVKGVEVIAGWRAVGVDPDARTVCIRRDKEERTLGWDELVLATGGRPRRLPEQPEHPRVSCFHTADDVTPLHQGLASGKIERVVLIGAGFLGCELSEAFRALWGVDVTLVEAAPAPLPLLVDPEVGAIVAQTLRENEVELRTASAVKRIEARKDGVSVEIDGESIAGDVAVVAVGVEPVVELAVAAGVRLGPTGAIAVDDRLATSVPHVWAAGDSAEMRHLVTGDPVHLPLGSLANRQGRVLANILAGGKERFRPVAGAAALKVFDLNVAATGITRRAAEARGEDVRSVWISAHDRAEYWPEAKEIAVHLVYRPDSGRGIGVQGVGEGDVTKRVDVATQLLSHAATLAEFAELEHAYSPPYAPALEPLAVAAMVAGNVDDGVEARSPEGPLTGLDLLDVRHVEEREARPVTSARVTSMPQESLREHVGELEPRQWVVLCERGTRSAEVVRLLERRGFSAQYLGGGLRWRGLAGIDPQVP